MVKQLIISVLRYLELNHGASFSLLSLVYCQFLFKINKTSKVMLISDVSLEVVETEIKATEKILKNIAIMITIVQ